MRLPQPTILSLALTGLVFDSLFFNNLIILLQYAIKLHSTFLIPQLRSMSHVSNSSHSVDKHEKC